MNSVKQFDYKTWNKREIFQYLTKLSLHTPNGLTMEFVEEEELGYSMVVRRKMELLDVYFVDTIYDLYQSNYILNNKYKMGNFLYAYPTFDGKTEQEVDEFIDMITDHIVYNE